MTEPNTQRGWEERFDKVIEKWLDEDAEISLIPVVRQFIATELTKAREEGRNQEKTEVSEACKRLAGLADFNHVSDEMRSSATLFLQRKAEEDKSNYIKFLQEKPEQALQSYRQELRKKVEGMKKPVSKVMSLMMKKGIFGKPLNDEINPMYHYNKAIEDLLTIISE